MSKLNPGNISSSTDEGRRYFVNADGTSTVIWHPNSPYPRNIYAMLESGGYMGMSFGFTGGTSGHTLKGDVFTLYVPCEMVFREALVPPRALYESSTFLFNEDCIDDLNGVRYDDYVKFRKDTYKLFPGKGLMKRGEKLTYAEIETPQRYNEGDIVLIVAAPDEEGVKMAQSIMLRKGETEVVLPSTNMLDNDWVPTAPLEEMLTWFPEKEEFTLQMQGDDYGLEQKELNPLPAYLEGKCIKAFEYVKKPFSDYEIVGKKALPSPVS